MIVPRIGDQVDIFEDDAPNTHVAFISIRCNDGFVVIMRFVVRGRFSEDAAKKLEMLPTELPDIWVRPPTIDSVNIELNRMSWPEGREPVQWRFIHPRIIPQETDFRDAWTDNGTIIEYNLEKARNIALNRAREARAPKLEQLDREWMRAIGQNNKEEAARIENLRQQLRDLPQILEPKLKEAKTIEEVRSLHGR